MRKTKIVATLGPASSSEAMVEKLILAGANVFRLNFSHGTAEQHLALATRIRATAARLNTHVGILADLQGPKIRIACFADDSIRLQIGDSFVIDAGLGSHQGDQYRVGTDYPALVQEVQAGNTLLLDDGRIQLHVERVEGEQVVTRVLVGGILSNRKGINVLGGGLSAPALTTKDKEDILTARQLEADFVAVSFPRSAADLEEARTLIRATGSKAAIVAKVERAEVVASVEAMDEIIQASDIIMVARGDLGVEIGDARLPGVQKKLIKRCRALGRPVITATQMMESMIGNPMPTRAEVLDVANAVMDGTDAVMLSAESAAGLYPVEAVEAMARIALGAEQEMEPVQPRWRRESSQADHSGRCMALAAMTSAFSQDRSCGIAVLTNQGEAVIAISRGGLHNPIWALSDNPQLLNQMTILRGVTPIFFQENAPQPHHEHLIAALQQADQLDGIHSLLISRLDSLEGAGHEDVCRLVSLSGIAHQPVPAAPAAVAVSHSH
ncbi:pyruvate kinase [Aeromonas enteropelogenes]|uniref:pyruvate kinase n=1 Tax=Aeromonas enteropelogenes TaxID=29489 RepID=UPI0005AAC145|nr:pyruvate kinase [Aeromonas enteropelogenes]UBH55083.1 pyruvate kinase [Aeromonas enteropelogenes]